LAAEDLDDYESNRNNAREEKGKIRHLDFMEEAGEESVLQNEEKIKLFYLQSQIQKKEEKMSKSH
jgi:hypothetical protein